MDLYQQYMHVLPHSCHAVRYEDLVADFDTQTRRMLQFIGVDWDDAVFDYAPRARQRGMINTPSYGQVTQPIHRRSCYRWKRYTEHLGPVIETLKPYARRFGYQDEDPAADGRSA
jgi:hypothetical protein